MEEHGRQAAPNGEVLKPEHKLPNNEQPPKEPSMKKFECGSQTALQPRQQKTNPPSGHK
jgi:hypothetical protein